jgi:hypothetical protein
MAAKTIDLGRSLKEEMGNQVPASMSDVHYPELHIGDLDDERLLDLPDEGTMEVKFKIVHRTHREESKGDSKKKRHTCSITMEIRAIDAPEKNGKKKTHWEMFNGG